MEAGTTDSVGAAVLVANSRFYSAVSEGNMAAMKAVWAEDHRCCCVHPGWGEAVLGREAVLESWSLIFRNQPGLRVACVGARAFMVGAHDDAAFVVGTEQLPGGFAACTNM